MIINNINGQKSQLLALKNVLSKIDYNRLYINTPVRPPAENNVKEPSVKVINNTVEILKGISIEQLITTGFFSNEKDHYIAIKTIIQRHPMNQFEIRSFLDERNCEIVEEIMERLLKDPEVQVNNYKNYKSYRIE